MKYKKLKSIYKLVFYGKNDQNRNADGSATSSSLVQTTVARLLTPYITNNLSSDVNSKIMRFNLNSCFNHVSLAENSYLYINSYLLPILNNADREYFTNLKLLGCGNNNEYNNLFIDNPVLCTNHHTGTIAYSPLLTPSFTSNVIFDEEIAYDRDGNGVIDTFESFYTIYYTHVEPHCTTTYENWQVLLSNTPTSNQIAIYNPLTTSYYDFVPLKIQGYNDFCFQFSQKDNALMITTQFDELVDILVVGPGGSGGSNYSVNGSNFYGGGGGSGEIVHLQNYVLPAGSHSIYLTNNYSLMAINFDITIGGFTHEIMANKGGIGGYFDGTNFILPTSGGSGGGGSYMNFTSNYTVTIANYITTTPTITPVDVVGDATYMYYAFTDTTQTYTFTTTENITCDVLIVGGGGSGGTRCGGGGGAGAVIYLQNQNLNTGTYTINVGKGGNAIASNTGGGSNGNNGDDSFIILNSVNIYLAKGGGGGAGSGTTNIAGKAGGSSGGGTWNTSSDNPLLTNIPAGAYGNKGGSGLQGNAQVTDYVGGGGGGANNVGGNATANGTNRTAGNGGNGISVSITGNTTTYGGGGGGGGGPNAVGNSLGGAGGGGAGSNGNTTATSGTANTGGGGGGSGYNTTNNGASGAGGSGIIIIRVPKTITINETINTYFNGAPAGTAFNNYGFVGDVNNGSTGSSLKAGNGGSATTSTISITGSNVLYSIGGTGASLGSTPASKAGLYGYGGDGGGGLGGDGRVIIRFKNLGDVFDHFTPPTTVFQPYSITYQNDFVNQDMIKINAVKVPKNFLSKNYIDFEINTLKSGGSAPQFTTEQLDRLIIDASVIELDNEISNN